MLDDSALGRFKIGQKWLLIAASWHVDRMGSFGQLILDALKDGSAKSFRDILSRGGLSHNTLKRYLCRSMDQGLVSRAEGVENRRGRPKYGYYLTSKSKKRLNLTVTEPYTSLVTLTFTKLKQICRHSEGGFCKARKGNCISHLCPQIVKSK